MEKQQLIPNFLQKLKNENVGSGKINGYEYFLLRPPVDTHKAINGYIVFPKRPVREKGYDGILSYVPVHGGITLAQEMKTGEMVYGFDTVHYNSELYPRNNPEWIIEQIGIMLAGILKAAEVEKKYLKCVSNKGKAKYAQMVQDIQPDQAWNMGVAINLLSGKL